jgi:hypothetical protein
MKHKNIYIILYVFAIIIAGLTGIQAQTLSQLGVTYTVAYNDAEKAVKQSASEIPSKKGCEWTSNVKSIIRWKTTFIDNTYTLYKNDIGVYSSSTIQAIRGYYLADLLGKPYPNSKPIHG